MAFDELPFSSFGGRRDRLSWSEYLKYGGLGLLLIGLIVLYVFEFEYFNRTLGVRRLVLSSLLAGLAVGIALGFLFRQSGKDLTEKIQIYVFFVVISMVFMPLMGSLSNRLLSFRPARNMQVEFVKEEPYYASLYGLIEGEKIEPTGYYLFFYKEQKLYRIENEKAMFPGKQRGELVEIPVKKGLWGVEWVLKRS